MITVAVLSGLARLRTDGIFACPAAGYSSDRYLAYCNAASYGDYEHGGIWFGLEPGVDESVAAADVLFLGNSRMQYAFSTPATEEWFAKSRWRYYLLGFEYYENATFAAALLPYIHSHASVYVINVDRFFDDVESEPGRAILHDPGAATKYLVKRIWQTPHRLLCGALAAICGRELALYRSRTNGSWETTPRAGFTGTDVANGPSTDTDQWTMYGHIAANFIATLPVPRECVVLTIVPTRHTRRAEAADIAASVGLDLLAPEVKGLRTFDGSHLDASSAELWARAFFEMAGPRIAHCVLRSNTHTTGTSSIASAHSAR